MFSCYGNGRLTFLPQVMMITGLLIGDKKMRVLLVEDDPTTAKSIELMLTHANLNVYCTDLGEEGIDLAKLYDYDLILLDLGLPDMNGHEVLRQLRLSRIDTPILILSGADDTENKIRGFGFGAVVHRQSSKQ